MEGDLLAAGSSEPIEDPKGSSAELGDGFNAKDTEAVDNISSENEVSDTVGVGDAALVSSCRTTARKNLVFAGGTRRVSNKTEKVSRRRHDSEG